LRKLIVKRIKESNEQVKDQPSDMDGAGYDESSAFLDNAVKYQRPEDWGDDDHTLFAVARDPVERFISAIDQATGAYGSTNNGMNVSKRYRHKHCDAFLTC
jgi:hypothetical protein